MTGRKDLKVNLNSPGRADHPQRLSPELELRRLVMSGRGRPKSAVRSAEASEWLAKLVPKVAAESVAVLAIKARGKATLRPAALLLVREMARHKSHRHLVADTLSAVIQRPGDLTEFVTIYWKDGRVPLSGQVKKGLAAAFPKFDERQLARHPRQGAVQLRDVLFLCHARPRNAAQAAVWKRLIWGRLKPADAAATKTEIRS